MENFKLQSRKTRVEKWLEPSNKSEITGFYMEKVANLLGISTSFLSPYFRNRLFWVHGAAKLVFVIVSVVLEADDLPAPILLRSLLSPLLPRLLVLWNSLSKSFWTNACRFSPSALFHVFEIYKWLHCFFWVFLTIHDSFYKRDILATGCLYSLNELTTC